MSSPNYISVAKDLEAHSSLVDVVRDKILPGLPYTETKFWSCFESLIREFLPANHRLLATRDELQKKIDDYATVHNPAEPCSQKFLREIGYLEGSKGSLLVDVADVDPEIADMHSPQLVVPLDNARYALNAANARWGSLFDALYGTNAIEDAPKASGKGYDMNRGDAVFKRGFQYLDKFLPLTNSVSWTEICGLTVRHGIDASLKLRADDLVLSYKCKNTGQIKNCLLQNRSFFVGSSVNPVNGTDSPESKKAPKQHYVFLHHGLHIILVIDKSHPAGAQSSFGLSDIILESAATAIMDLEDSVAAVDAEDKSKIYVNWVGLMKGNLSVDVRGKTRKLNPDKVFRRASDGKQLRLPGRAVLLVRNVGIHMFTDAVKFQGKPVPEGILDLLCTVTGALHDVLGRHENSRAGSIYIVKPKMHGPGETKFVVETFERVEQLLNLPKCMIKIGIMDEERRTSVNLRCVLRAAQQRVVFINTGFLDRCGDEIHTCFRQGPVLPKAEIKSHKDSFLHTYEKRNVQVGIQAGVHLHGQIGKGMWAEPDNMNAMLKQKIGHPNAAANCAWVPGPVAGVLHALHYHEVDVNTKQMEIGISIKDLEDGDTPNFDLDKLLNPPLYIPDKTRAKLTKKEIETELTNNMQGLLGYVVRWVQMGVGCSKVPDFHGIDLMEDRATLRISSQHIANWLYHGIVTKEEVMKTFREMINFVNKQNEKDSSYTPMKENSLECKAALELIFEGEKTKNGYTEEILHRYRRMVKDRHSSIQSSPELKKAKL